ncbi:d85af470-7588-469a-a851-ef29e9c6b5be [Thermothielavioides terrestris]|uniref:D85af470-7588-469a-a851-ef29e9c6b5be n=1 Tax=Thermothielavioides terrestris TaxID=2587410 RepID=A0A3S4BFI3_9PEZI|nr:d85af470-7588-469a-a851-ef29e9c6b5be [Thermothielavioides terrestris]
MASRILSQGARALARTAPIGRSFSTSPARLDAAAAAPLPARRPIGALRGGLFGFFLGSTLAGGAVYYYAIQEYKASNELLTEDIYALQNAVDRLSTYLATLEEKMEALERKKK